MMRYRICFGITVFVFFILFTCAQATIYQEDVISEYCLEEKSIRNKSISSIEQHNDLTRDPSNDFSCFVLPASLQIIEENAFEGTALSSVNIPETVISIGDHAFANIPTLKSITMPDDIQFIGEDAFIGSFQVILIASSNSYAGEWAKENGVPLRLPVIFYTGNEMIQYSYQNDITKDYSEVCKETQARKQANSRERRTGRTIGDLKSSCYKGVSALYIQSRFFP